MHTPRRGLLIKAKRPKNNNLNNKTERPSSRQQYKYNITTEQKPAFNQHRPADAWTFTTTNGLFRYSDIAIIQDKNHIQANQFHKTLTTTSTKSMQFCAKQQESRNLAQTSNIYLLEFSKKRIPFFIRRFKRYPQECRKNLELNPPNRAIPIILLLLERGIRCDPTFITHLHIFKASIE